MSKHHLKIGHDLFDFCSLGFAGLVVLVDQIDRFEKVIQPRLAGTCGEREDDEIDNADTPVIVAGFGRFGQVVSRLLKASGFESTLLDHDAGQIDLTGRFGSKVFFWIGSSIIRIKLLLATDGLRFPSMGS